MENELKGQEGRKRELLKKIESMGDIRRGTISVNFRKCGKKNCICATPGHRGHGPQYLWSTTIDGKSYARNLRLGAEMEKVRKETENCRAFTKWCREWVEVNEKICDLRAVEEVEDEDELSALKKKLQRMFKWKLKKR